MQTFTAPISGNYKLEVWGAQGGTYFRSEHKTFGAGGGYSIGYRKLNISDKLYICVGAQGGDSYVNNTTGGNGGYNGGGKGGDGYSGYGGGGGGGGATHIAITSNRGELKNYKDYYLSELLVVAGGGGGAGVTASCGRGGGLNGGDAHSGHNVYTIQGANQTSGYAFGQGQDGKTKTTKAYWGVEGNGGGGGGFYGGPACQTEGSNSNCGGAGGSGYIGGLTNGTTIAGDQAFPSPSGGTETGHEGDGYCIISWISPSL